MLVGVIVASVLAPKALGPVTTLFVSACVMVGFYATFRIVLYLLVALIMVLVWIVVGFMALIKLI